MASSKSGNGGQRNAHQSTGPKTAEGKEIASHNATKHGVLSRRLFLNDENPKEFYELLDELIADQRPVGRLETFIVERMAITIWRQLRLIRAEAAQIEIERQTGSEAMIAEAGRVVKKDQGSLNQGDFKPLTKEEEKRLEIDQAIVAEYEENKILLDGLADEDLSHLEDWTPILYKRLQTLAITFNNDIGKFLRSEEKTLATWAREVAESCEKELKLLIPRQQLSSIAGLLRDALSTPERHSLLGRYQTSLDNDLYKGLKSLHEAQSWRQQLIEPDAGNFSEGQPTLQEDEGAHANWQDDQEEEWP